MSEIRMFRVNGYDNTSGDNLEFYFKVEDDESHVLFNLGVDGNGIYFYSKGSQILTPNENESTRNRFDMISMNSLKLLFEALKKCEWFENGDIEDLDISLKDDQVIISPVTHNEIDDEDQYVDLENIDENTEIEDLDELDDEDPEDNETRDDLYAELVRKKTPSPTVEIDVVNLPEEYRGDWTDTIVDITKEWMDTKNFNQKGTIWMWTAPSANFQRGYMTSTEFLIPLGFSNNFLNFLSLNLKKIFGKSVIRMSKHISYSSEWATLCHVQEGKIWQELDITEYRRIR